MAVLDILQKVFSGGGPDNNISPDGRDLKGPIVSYLEQMGLSPPIDQGAESHRQIQKALLAASKALTSSTQDFLPALGGAVSAGAEGYSNAKDDTEAKKAARNKELLATMLGLVKTDQTDSIAQARDASTNARIDELARHNMATEGQGSDNIDLKRLLGLLKIDQGNTKLSQGQETIDQNGTKIGETGRHNLVTEGQGQQKVDLGMQHVTLAREKAAQDAKTAVLKIAAEGSRDKLTQAQIAETKQKTKVSLLNLKLKELGMSESLRTTDPEAYKKASEEYVAYKDTLDKELDQNAPAADAASAIPAPQLPQSAIVTPLVRKPGEAAQPQAVGSSKDNPAQLPPDPVAAKAAFDALPPGTYFINPKTGKLAKKAGNGPGG